MSNDKINENEVYDLENDLKLLSSVAWDMKAPINEDNTLIIPEQDIINDLKKFISKYNLPKRELFYHFGLGDWTVDLADTKKSMINYDVFDLIYSLNIKVDLKKETGETVSEFKERKNEKIAEIRNQLVQLYRKYHRKTVNKIHESLTHNMTYNELLSLFKETWKNVPFPLEPLLEQMAQLMGDKAVIQNVVGDSGNFKSTRSMIEFNTLPRVLIMDDATLPGISRMQLTQGQNFLDGTIVYYNDVGDSGIMKKNFNECLESAYKKLYSEGYVNRIISGRNSDYTIRLILNTQSGFKMKCNSVKPLFTNDFGQTASRIQTINIPSQTKEQVIEMITSDLFDDSNPTKKDPRIFKYIFEAYMTKKTSPSFDKNAIVTFANRAIDDNNGDVNLHIIGREKYKNKQMLKLYGKDYYTKYFVPHYVEADSTPAKALELKELIMKMVKVHYSFEEVQNHQDVRFRTIAKTKSSDNNKKNVDYDAFTITAVNGIRAKFINEHKAEIPTLIKTLEDNEEIIRIGDDRGKNVYVIINKDKVNVSA